MKASFALAGALALLADSATSQNNDVNLNNGGDVLFLYSTPSVGFPTGSVPPDAGGDLFWKVLPGNRVLAHSTPAGGSSMTVIGYFEELLDTDWSTPPPFYDRTHGPALPSATFPGLLEPAFFQLGFTSEITVSLGPSGFGPPCTLASSMCSPAGCTGPPGYLAGWQIEWSLGTGITIPADGTGASDHAVTWFLPGGMPGTGGTCGMGDYVVQDIHSIDETQADVAGGINPYGGFQLAGSGPIPDAVTDTTQTHPSFRERVLNVVADSGTGLGPEQGTNGGGAMNGLHLSVGSGQATIGVEIRSLQDAGVPNVAVAISSLAPVAPPGIPFLGGFFLVLPDAVSTITSSVWNGVVAPGAYIGTLPQGFFLSPPLAVPATAVGLDLYTQGGVLDLTTGVAGNTNRVRTSLLP